MVLIIFCFLWCKIVLVAAISIDLLIGSLSLFHGFFPVLYNRILVFQSPFCQRIDVWKQRTCPPSQRIFHPWRHFGIYGTGDIAVIFQCSQSNRQHLLGYVGDFALQFFETYRSLVCLVQRVYDQKRPFVTKPCQDIPYRAVRKYGVFYCCPVHNIMYFNSLYKGKQIPFKRQETF